MHSWIPGSACGLNFRVYFRHHLPSDFGICKSPTALPRDLCLLTFVGIIPKEKPSEIKTVRIVKREAERRNKDKKRVTYDDSSLVQVIEDNDIYEDDEIVDGIETINVFLHICLLHRIIFRTIPPLQNLAFSIDR